MLRPLYASRCLFSYIYTPRVVAMGSCIMLLNLRGLLISIAAAAFEAPADLRVVLPLQLHLHSLGRRGGELHRAA